MNNNTFERLEALSPGIVEKAKAVAAGAVSELPSNPSPSNEPAHTYSASPTGSSPRHTTSVNTDTAVNTDTHVNTESRAMGGGDVELAYMSLADASAAIQAGSLSPLELIEALVARAGQLDSRLDAYLLPRFDQAIEEAREAQRSIARHGPKSPLHGLPFGLKDIIDTAGIRTTCHSRILIDHVPTEDAAVAARLSQSGAILMGKLATHEFAFGGPCFDLPFPPARNPWNTSHHPGGSSSGSGASVAAGLLPAALGSDTGGSVRNPASCCGLVGMKPTYGRVPRSGVFPLAYSLDNIGPLTRTVRDNAMMLQVLAGPDLLDPASADAAVPDYCGGLGQGIRNLRIGVIRHFHEEDMEADPEVAAGIDEVARVFSGLGARVGDTRLRPLSVYSGGNRIILTVEGFAVHRRWLEERPQDYAAMTREKMLPGAFISGPDYLDALRLRHQLRDEFGAHMENFDALICVSSMEPPCRIDDEDEVARTYPRQARAAFNFLGCPAMSVPCGFHSNGLPLSFQIVGKAFDEAMLYKIADAYETATRWCDHHPTLTA